MNRHFVNNTYIYIYITLACTIYVFLKLFINLHFVYNVNYAFIVHTDTRLINKFNVPRRL